MKPCNVGWARTKFEKLDNIGLETLITTVTRDALSEHGVFCQSLAAYLL